MVFVISRVSWTTVLQGVAFSPGDVVRSKDFELYITYSSTRRMEFYIVNIYKTTAIKLEELAGKERVGELKFRYRATKPRPADSGTSNELLNRMPKRSEVL